jgi:hypothetical protein
VSESGKSTGDLLDALREDVRMFVREELRSAQGEMKSKARKITKSSAMLGSAGVLGALALGTTTLLLVRVLDRYLPPRVAALVATVALGGGAAALAAAGVQELRRVRPPVPDETLAKVQDDVHAARVASEQS